MGAIFGAAVAAAIASLVVTAGFTPGTFRVTESGAAEYGIPIQVPPGIAGMEPKLAHAYSSQGGNGISGVGWGVAGLSVIARCPRTFTQDGFKGAVNHNADDRYCLDGQRLVATSGNYGAEGTAYRTERETFTKVISSGVAGNGPASFKAWTKSGQILEYGTTDDSLIEAQGKPTARLWALNKVQDTKGNYFTISYFEDNSNGEYRPARIDYTGNANNGLSPFNSVQFVYSPRSDVSSFYEAGSVIRTTQRLTSIRTFAGATLVREHRLIYDTGGVAGRSRLTSIRECENGVTCFAPTVLGWEAPGNGFGATFSSGVLDWGHDAGRAWVDFNGDGRADFCRLVGNTNLQSSFVQCTVSNGTGVGETYTSGLIDWGHEAGRAWVDFNGDGKADFCRLVGNTNLQSSFVQCTVSTGTGFGETYTSGLIDWGHDAGRAWVDFNGDGRADFCRLVGNTNLQSSFVQCTVSNGAGFAETYTSGLIDWGHDAGRAWVDFNGDGRADFCRLVGNTNLQSSFVQCTVSTRTGFAETYTSGLTDWGYEAGRAWVDFNGDGKADFCRLVGNTNLQSSFVQCTVSTGAGFAETYTSGVIDWGYEAGRAWVDFNGDGKADFCRLVGNTNLQSSFVQCTVSTGAGFAETFGSGVIDWGHEAGRDWADFEGGGKAGYCRRVGDQNLSSSYVSCTVASLPVGDVVSGITSGLGALTSLVYKPLTDSTVYARDTTSTYPIQDIQLPLRVVSSIAQSNGIGSTVNTNYFYAGGKADVLGGGFLGFRKMESVDAQTGIKAATVFRQDYPFQGLPTQSLKTQSSGTVILQVDNQWTDALLAPAADSGGKYHSSQLTQAVERSFELNGSPIATVTTSTTYDAFGNTTRVALSTGDGHSKTTTNTYYADDVANWLLGRLKSATVQSTVP